MASHPQPEQQVLSTLGADGKRRWLKPVLNAGTWWSRRRTVAYVLIAIFTVMPFVKIQGKPAVLLDVVNRQLTFFGQTFLPTDTVLLVIAVIGVLLGIFTFTALFGRVWCGWGCPQTVYMEFLFRPIERFFDGTAGRGGKVRKSVAWKTAAKYVVYLLACMYLANTFLAYFVGIDRLAVWVCQSPFRHPIPFLVMATVTVAMMFDFCFFREQMCTVACPYGRFQSVLLDDQSLVVSYDKQRGEPRGKFRKTSISDSTHPTTTTDNDSETSSLPILGDCIDCKKCVTTCPTGIDIREGLQMECIHCTQCIDACNTVMSKIGRDPNLIRFSSHSHDAGLKSSLVRARTIVYPLLLCGVFAAFLTVFSSRHSFDALLLSERHGKPFYVTRENLIKSRMKIELTNRLEEAASYQLELIRPTDGKIVLVEDDWFAEPGETKTFHFSVLNSRSAFQNGRTDLELKLTGKDQDAVTLKARVVGPR